MKQLLFVLLLCISAPVFADEIHLQDGSIYRGRIIQVTPQHVEYDPDGPRAFDIIPRGQIQKLVYDDGNTILLNEGTRAAAPPSGQASQTVQHTQTAAPPAAAPARNESGVHRHDGWFFRAQFGAGSGLTTVEAPSGTEIKYEGAAANLRIQFGYAFIDNLAVFIDEGYTSMAEPDVSVNGNTVNNSDSSVFIRDIGIGVTYYFMPLNLYISASLLAHYITFEGSIFEGDTKNGPAMHLSVGKEWWVSDDWGIGVAFFVFSGSTTARDDSVNIDYDINSTVVGIAFSATYN